MGWLKQVLADAVAAKQLWPEWATAPARPALWYSITEGKFFEWSIRGWLGVPDRMWRHFHGARLFISSYAPTPSDVRDDRIFDVIIP